MESQILKCLKCHNCKTNLEKRVFNCKIGHRFCENCKSSLRDCSICKNLITGTRNMALEVIIKELNDVIKDFKPSDNSTMCEQKPANKQEELCIGLSIKITRKGATAQAETSDGIALKTTNVNISEMIPEESDTMLQLCSTKKSDISTNQGTSSKNLFAGYYESSDKENSIATDRVNENIPPARAKGRVIEKITACFNNNAQTDSPIYIKTENCGNNNNNRSEEQKSNIRQPFKVLLDNKPVNFLQCPVNTCKTQYADFMALKGHLNYIHTNCFTVISFLQRIDINLSSSLSSSSVRKIVKFLGIFFVIDCYCFSSTWFINVGMIFDSRQSDKSFKFRINHDKKVFKIEAYPHQEPLKGVCCGRASGVQKVTVHFLAK